MIIKAEWSTRASQFNTNKLNKDIMCLKLSYSIDMDSWTRIRDLFMKI